MNREPATKKRQAQRYRVELPVQVRVRDGDDPPAWGRTTNMSRAGAAFLTDFALRCGQHLSLEVTIGPDRVEPYSYTILAHGTVVRCATDGESGRTLCAVQFTEPAHITEWSDATTAGPAS